MAASTLGPVSESAEHEENTDALPAVLDQTRIISGRPAPAVLPERAPGLVIPAVQAAAVAAGGFVVGAAVVGLAHRRQRHSAALGKGRGGRSLGGRGAKGNELLQIVGSRSLLVDVHLLGGRGGDR
jgi:hypothetical protein